MELNPIPLEILTSQNPIRCLACQTIPPEHGSLDSHHPPDGWIVGTFKRKTRTGFHLYEVSICPEHGLYTAVRDPGLFGSNDQPKLVKPTLETAPAKCRHCGTYFPSNPSKKIGWGIARLARWNKDRVIEMVFPVCPDHTLTGGPRIPIP